ncbi:hypothetical protein Q1695_006014 [Nippostrongylus brasiliensis]|nr:hypothetical protein Q1695_006014 [Nippostrongylus brasiliensis]
MSPILSGADPGRVLLVFVGVSGVDAALEAEEALSETRAEEAFDRLFFVVDDIAKKTPKKPTFLTHRIWLVINSRRRCLRLLRKRNEEAFHRVINELKIATHS